MKEIELKFQIPDAGLDAVLSAVHRLSGLAGHAPWGPPVSQHLQAAYFDTLDRKLARARAALRVRQEDDQWVQTLKAASANPMVRLEDNVNATPPKPGEPIWPDLSLHHGDAAAALQRDLGWQPETDPQGHACGLRQLYRTDIHRHRADLEVQDAEGRSLGWVELAVDLGAIHAGTHTLRVQELEIEAKDGSAQAVLACGRDWAERFGLWLDVQTKAHRGDQLARQAATEQFSPAPPLSPRSRPKSGASTASAASVASGPTAGATLPAALAAAQAAALEQIAFNMSEVGAPSHHADFDKSPWQHAWAVGLRRMAGLLLGWTGRAAANQALVNELNRLAMQVANMSRQVRQADATQAMLLARSLSATQLCLDLLALEPAQPASA